MYRAACWALTAIVLCGSARLLSQPIVAPVVFEEVAGARGLRFVTEPGRTDRRYQPETMVAGVAVFDYNGDGWLDVYAVNGAPMTTLEKSGPEYWNRLFRNDGRGSFTDVTEAARVSGHGYDLGIVAGDYDNDGDSDLFVAGLRRNTLYRNNGDGTFTDVTEAAGLARRDSKYGALWAIAGAFLDYNGDGRLDLFVSNYVVWDRETDPPCGDPGSPDYCAPSRYEGLPNSLFRNNGDGTFAEVSAVAGIRAHIGKGMGIGVADFDDNGWSDVFVANDTTPAFLFMNNGNEKFTEAGFERGVALPERGAPVAGMGVDARDVDNDGRPDVFVTALTADMFPLFRNLRGGAFEDVTIRSAVGGISRPFTGWGNAIVDLNNDGWKDLFAACGGVLDPRGAAGARVPMPNALFLNRGDGRFTDGSAGAGDAFARRAVHRGVAVGDIDNDGRMDVIVTSLEAPIELWRNVSPAPNHWLLVQLMGTKSNRGAIGARLEVATASGKQYNTATAGVGYGSSSDPRVHFGLGKDALVKTLTVRWPSGAVTTLTDVPADQVLRVREPG
jgi:hypothetical protein